MGLEPVAKMSAPRVDSLSDKCAELCGVDLRSLAAFRMGAATILLFDLWFRGQEITAYFTDQGVLPRWARIDLIESADPFGFRHMWSLHMASGQYWAQLLLLLVAAWFAVWLLIGYRTRLAAFVSWVLLVSLDARNPVILNSGDVLLRSMLLWSLFLPLGARWSVDAWSSGAKLVSRRVCSAASLILLLQLCLMYWVSAAFKTHPVEGLGSIWTGELTGVYYALHCDAYATPAGIWLREFPEAMRWLTAGSWWLELLGPLLAFVPLATRWLRCAVVAAFTAFHLGLAATLTLGLFPAICIVCWWLFLPASFWDALQRRASAWTSGFVEPRWRAIKTWLERARPRLFRHPERPAAARWFPRQTGWRGRAALARRIGIDTALLLLFLYVVVWNVRELDFKTREPLLMSRNWNAPARALGLDQNWSMFAPLPRTQDGWLVMQGTLHNGRQVNLWRFDEPLPWDKPPVVSAIYRTQRWRKYLDNLTVDHYGPHRLYFCNWLAWRWNEQQAQDDSERQVYKVELVHRIELTPPPGQPIPTPESKTLWTWYYEQQ